MQQQHEGIACYVTAKYGSSCRLQLLARKTDSNIARAELETRRTLARCSGGNAATCSRYRLLKALCALSNTL